MIEKLQTSLAKEINAYSMTQNHVVAGIIIDKINELIDVVNELQTKVEIVEEHLHPTAKTDPYAEQRKWIGKLCRFWNFKNGAVDIGILKAVDNLKPTIPYINDIDCSYAFCEPVKPDDDIIYKGE